MAAKKKKRKEKGTYKQFENLSLDQIIQNVEDTLSSENPRDALYTLKFATKKFGESASIRSLFFRAYLLREKQLRTKSLHAEADAVRELANRFVPEFDQMPEAVLADYISAASGKKALEAYAGYMKNGDRSSKIEQTLAYLMFTGRDWKAVESLEADHPLRQDAGPVQKAAALMNDAVWEQALDALNPISRTSPYASIRVFCRAMVSFFRGDDKAAARALEMIPPDFPLSRTIGQLKRVLNPAVPEEEKKAAMEAVGFLWDGPVNIERDIRHLIDCIDRKRFKQAVETVHAVASAIHPSESLRVTRWITECLWRFSIVERMDDYDFQKMVQSLLPKEIIDPMFMKIRLVMSIKPFTSAGSYISDLSKEFPDPEERKLAHALTLLHTAMFLNLQDGHMQFRVEHPLIGRFRDQLGIRSDTYEGALLDMVTHSIGIDPGNRKAYEYLAGLPRNSREDKKKVESGFSVMLKEFPDDPFPCLELASLFYESNAFRKAENILEEAMKRAPHDARVLDRHVLSLLISSEINIRREKFHLAERDLDRAAAFENKKLEPFVLEKKLLFDLKTSANELEPDQPGTKKQISLFGERRTPATLIYETLAEYSLYDRLKVMSLLRLDLDGKKLPQKTVLLKSLDNLLGKELKAGVKALGSSQVFELLAPIGKEYDPLYESIHPAPLLIKRSKALLNVLSTDDALRLYERILLPSLYKAIIKDLRSRAKEASEKDRRLLDFFRVTIDHLSGKKEDSDLFYEVIDEVEEGPALEALRALSRRLSRHAAGPLRAALEEFDFEILDETFGGFPGLPFDLDLDDFLPRLEKLFGGAEAEEDTWDEDRLFEALEVLSKIGMTETEAFQDELEWVIEEAEDWVDSLDIRGYPNHLIKQMRNMLFKTDPEAKQELNMIARVLEQTGTQSNLSREGQVLLFGKARKK